MRSRIEPMKKIARSLREHRELILNYFRAQKLLSSGVVEGLNNKAKVTMRKSSGSEPSEPSNSLSITHWESSPNLSQPTIFSDEPKKEAPGKYEGDNSVSRRRSTSFARRPRRKISGIEPLDKGRN